MRSSQKKTVKKTGGGEAKKRKNAIAAEMDSQSVFDSEDSADYAPVKRYIRGINSAVLQNPQKRLVPKRNSRKATRK
jgi:hypothetical protein